MSDPILEAARKYVETALTGDLTIAQLDRLRLDALKPFLRTYAAKYEQLWQQANDAAKFDTAIMSVNADLAWFALSLATAGKGDVATQASIDVVKSQVKDAILSPKDVGGISAQQRGVSLMVNTFGNSATSRLAGRLLGCIQDGISLARTGKRTAQLEYEKRRGQLDQQMGRLLDEVNRKIDAALLDARADAPRKMSQVANELMRLYRPTLMPALAAVGFDEERVRSGINSWSADPSFRSGFNAGIRSAKLTREWDALVGQWVGDFSYAR